MPVENLLNRWRTDPEVAGNFTAWETLPATPAQVRAFPNDLHPLLVKALQQQGINALYSHQEEALQACWAGSHTIIVTRTASGKTLCYNLPVLDALLRDPQARALFIFPTKALAQDQLSGLRSLLNNVNKYIESPDHAEPSSQASLGAASPITSAIYDGDTPTSSRPAIRENAGIILSNPDMLHTGILPYHTGWAKLFQNLHYVIIDEMHVYRGVFGSHVANVLRRLRRVARFYGSAPQFILTSATIANPLELGQGLVEPETSQAKMVLIDQNGAEHGEKHFLIYNPPLVDVDLGLRKSALQESLRLASDLIAYQVQTILFARSRRTVELLLTYLREQTSGSSSQWPAQGPGTSGSVLQEANQSIRGYRSGYLPQQRREIERGLRQGTVRVVVATNALELGIDIGAMGASLLVGYPGSIAAAWQQAGRAGRSDQSALAILVTTPDPLDQFLANHPDYFFGRSPELALINPDNLLILLAHIRCASFELPFQQGDRFGNLEPARLQEFLDFLVDQGLLHRSRQRYFWMADQYPAQAVSLRSASTDNIVLQVEQGGSSVIGQVDRASALWLVHPNAIYLHEGQTFLVEALDLDQNIAHLAPVSTDYYTEHRSETTVQLLDTYAHKPVQGGEISYGEITVTSQVTGYRQIHWHTRAQLGTGELDMPPTELQTTAYWLSLSTDTIERLRELGLWKNDPNQYGPGWLRQRDQARARDGYRCQVCGVPEQGRAHDVHHKVPFRLFVTAAQANQLDNLVTVCPTCHRRIETAVRVRSGLSGLGFVLGHLAPLFLMCDARDLGVHVDPQSSLANGQPVVALYDQVPAGIGLSQRLYEIHSDLIGRARQLVSECPCSDGCPSCIGPGGEGLTATGSSLGGKMETLAILKAQTD